MTARLREISASKAADEENGFNEHPIGRSWFLIRARMSYLDFVVLLSLPIFSGGRRELRGCNDKYGFVSVHFYSTERSFTAR